LIFPSRRHRAATLDAHDLSIVRVFLFLLLTTAAAAQPIQCVPDDYRAVSVMLQYDSPYKLVRIARPKMKGMARKRIGDVAIYTRVQKGDENFRTLDMFAERGGVWYQVLERRGAPVIGNESYSRPETEAPAVITRAKPGQDIVRVTWVEQWMGANRAGLTRRTVLLDFRAKPRVLLAIDCSDAGGGGACTAPDAAHEPRSELTCDADLRCTIREPLDLDWATRSATRIFDLLTNKTFAPSRFDAVTYASGTAFAAAAPESIRQRALIAGIGAVYPLYEVSAGKVLFAAHVREPVVGFRFFLLDRGTWREIPLTLLTDDVYPGENLESEQAGSLSRGYALDGPQPVFSADELEVPGGKQKVIEVLAVEGVARSLYWILFDPNGRTGALRLASDQPEWRHCGNVVYPISASWLGIPDSGFPAQVQAVASWRWWAFRDHQLPRTCSLVGTIDWSPKRGWIVHLGQSPCTDPMARPFSVTIDDRGDLRTEAVTFSQ
jgi:hypothetical protein